MYKITAPGLRMLNARDQYLFMVRHKGEPYGVPEKASTA